MEKLTKDIFDVVVSEGVTLVDFYADWCGPCKMMGPVLDELAQEMPEVQFRKVNVDEEPELAKQYGIMSIPALKLFKNGKVVNEQVGFAPKPMIANFVKTAK